MKKINDLINARLKGATILEPMIALMIIAFSLTASLLVVMKSNSQNNIQQHARAMAASDDVFANTFAKTEYLDKNWEDNGLNIERECKWYDQNHNLLDVHVSIFDSKEKLLISRHKIIEVNEAGDK